MPLLGTAIKQPSEVEKYSISYSNDLESGDIFTILATTITALDGAVTGLPTIESSLVDAINQKVHLLISGGTAGFIYKITVRIQTDTDRVLEDEFKLKIKES